MMDRTLIIAAAQIYARIERIYVIDDVRYSFEYYFFFLISWIEIEKRENENLFIITLPFGNIWQCVTAFKNIKKRKNYHTKMVVVCSLS